MRRPPRDDSFVLYDLRVEVVATERPMVCNHAAGSYFELKGENLSLPPGQTFPIYPLAALLPLLPAKQRVTHPHDWMTTDAEIACPDPNCGGRFRITRTGSSTFRHGEVTAVPLPRTARRRQVRPARRRPRTR
ncbi:MAG: TIGR04076 family protein [Vicinamibacterales bacterium]